MNNIQKLKIVNNLPKRQIVQTPSEAQIHSKHYFKAQNITQPSEAQNSAHSSTYVKHIIAVKVLNSAKINV